MDRPIDSPIITLTTDWGTKDFFAGMVKGRLLSMVPNARIVDITLELEPHNIPMATFVVRNGCLHFPAGTIHIIDINSVETAQQAFVVVEHNEQFFICTDNGLPYAVFGKECNRVVRLDVMQDSDYYNFAAYNLFCQVASMLAHGTPLEELGTVVSTLRPSTPLNYVDQGSRLIAHIAYIDSYGNAYLDITHAEFERVRAGRPFTMQMSDHTRDGLSRIASSYDDSGSLASAVLTVSATGLLEIAINRNSAEQLLGLHPFDHMIFNFQER
ncbi:MAG: SAM-dependent chlorinase/fluorinase [Bacteroidales bacterium]|nr:SAM-dependent chlorinase/fluorinase [Bacteroidales bacterium]